MGYIISGVSQTAAEHRKLELAIADLDERLRRLLVGGGPGAAVVGASAVDRVLAELSAARFHLRPRANGDLRMVAIIGGTGTGKSTLLNRFIDAGQEVTAASFRRTFTAGAVAVAPNGRDLPDGWLGLPHVIAARDDWPARGAGDRLTVLRLNSPWLSQFALVDTPDLDGDQPAHHALADRAFRWAHAVVFLVTPEKYQMTELPPYYRLARRYGVPLVFVMNKADDSAVLADYTRQLQQSHGISQPRVFCIPRDDAAFSPPPEQDLHALRAAVATLDGESDPATARRGLETRLVDLFQRLRDQALHPLLDARRDVDRLLAALRELSTPLPDVNVHPVTQQLQRRLQQRSVLYLMGPQRIFDRVRQVPLMLARLPRHTWDLLRHGQLRASTAGANGEDIPDDWQKTGPDFRGALVDQFTILHSRIDDIVRSSSLAERWIAADASGYAAARVEAEEAGRIAEEELADLRAWLEKHWNAVPRDTRVVQSLLKVIPGGPKLLKMSEAAPYLLAVVVAAHHSVFGPVDLLILGGFSLATWMTEKLSNEVAARTRLANQRIADRFTQLAQRQTERMAAWIERQAPPRAELQALLATLDRLHESLSPGAAGTQG